MFDYFHHSRLLPEKQEIKMCEGTYTFAHFYNFYKPSNPAAVKSLPLRLAKSRAAPGCSHAQRLRALVMREVSKIFDF